MKAKFYVELPLGKGTKLYTYVLGHMTKMAVMPIYGKTFQNLFQKKLSYDLETWHGTLCTQSLQSLYKL